MVFVKCPFIVAHGVLGAPGFGDHHHHGMRERTATHDQEFQDIIEHRGIAAALLDDGQQFFKILAEQAAGHGRLADFHSVPVSAQGVYFAVMRAETERVGEFPRGHGVGAVSLVNHRECAPEIGVLEVEIEVRQVAAVHKAFIDDLAG